MSFYAASSQRAPKFLNTRARVYTRAEIEIFRRVGAREAAVKRRARGSAGDEREETRKPETFLQRTLGKVPARESPPRISNVE